MMNASYAASDEAEAATTERQAVNGAWVDAVKPFKRPHRLKSWWQIINSVVPFFALFYAMYASTFWSYWLTLVLSIPAAGLLVRLFIIQHDCGHQSFFRSHRANDVLGMVCSLFTLTPYYLWRRSHSRHHASSGNLGNRGHGDVWVLTVNEYRSVSRLKRLQYRAYRHPFFLFIIAPSLLFILSNRLTYGIPRGWKRERRNVHWTNLAIGAVLVASWYTIGLTTFLMVYAPIVIVASSIGSWLFFIQHQYEHAYWQPDDRWDFSRSAFEGSSYYQLPRVLQWFTGNIGFHHIHHLESRIPNYNLPRCFAVVPELRQAVTLGIWDSVQCSRLKLWDEQLQRMVTFREVKCG